MSSLMRICSLLLIVAAARVSDAAVTSETCQTETFCTDEHFPCGGSYAAFCAANAQEGCTASSSTCNDTFIACPTLGHAKITCNYGAGPVIPGGD